MATDITTLDLLGHDILSRNRNVFDLRKDNSIEIRVAEGVEEE